VKIQKRSSSRRRLRLWRHLGRIDLRHGDPEDEQSPDKDDREDHNLTKAAAINPRSPLQREERRGEKGRQAGRQEEEEEEEQRDRM